MEGVTTCRALIPYLLPRRKRLVSLLNSKSVSNLKSAVRFTSLSSSSSAAASDISATHLQGKVDKLLTRDYQVGNLLKMERRSKPESNRWFPYLDIYKASESLEMISNQIIEALDPYTVENRKDRIKRVVENKSYSVCLVVEGLADFGNVSAAFRSADALGVQSVHVIAANSKKRCCLVLRYKDNHHVSMGAEKWLLDIETWNSPVECFEALRIRGYRIVTTHLGTVAVSIHDLARSHPTAVVVGNEKLGISEEALKLSDLHCSIPMKGMVDSFNVSVAAGILMHHAVCDRLACLALIRDADQALLSKDLATLRSDLPPYMVPFTTSDLVFRKPEDGGQKLISLLRAMGAYAEGFSADPVLRRINFLWDKLES